MENYGIKLEFKFFLRMTLFDIYFNIAQNVLHYLCNNDHYNCILGTIAVPFN